MEEPLKEIDMLKRQALEARQSFENYCTVHQDQHMMMDSLIKGATKSAKNTAN